MSRIYSFLLASLIVLSPSFASAQKILIWGIQEGCETLAEMDKILLKHLKRQSQDAELLFPKPSSCVGEACAKVVRASCATATAPRPSLQTGKLVGGRIYRTSSRTTSRFRVWLHDLASGQTAYRDTYCQDCNLIYALPQAVDALLDKPAWQSGPPNSTPLYCQAGQAAPRTGGATRPPVSRYLVSVSGEGKSQKAVLAGIKPLMRQTLLPVDYIKELRSGDDAELRRLAGPQRDAQVLGVEVNRDGGATLWLYDAATEKTQSAPVDCPGCEADDLLRKIDNALSPLLATCFSGNCASAQSKPYPEEACTPIVEPSCSDSDGPGASGSARRHIDPSTATLIKAGLWGLFGVGAATSLALFIANETSAGVVVSGGHEHYQTLTRPAWAVAGMSLAVLGIAIPTTLVVKRAQRASGTSGSGGREAALVCPAE